MHTKKLDSFFFLSFNNTVNMKVVGCGKSLSADVCVKKYTKLKSIMDIEWRTER